MTEPAASPSNLDTSVPRDEDLAGLAIAGDSHALEILLARHQSFLFNVALRMFQSRENAEDATQEVLLKITTRLSSFRGQSAFRTWAYRIAANHFLDCKRSAAERAVSTVGCFGAYLDRAVGEDFTGEELRSPETALLVEEAKLSCSLGVLLCLDRDQRLVFILGEIFEVGDSVGGEVTETTKDNFRQKLGRAREQVSSFMRSQCGLLDPRNPCRCTRKTKTFIRAGIVDPRRLTFLDAHVTNVRLRAPSVEPLLHETAGELFRAQPMFAGPDLVTRLRDAIRRPEWVSIVDGDHAPEPS